VLSILFDENVNRRIIRASDSDFRIWIPLQCNTTRIRHRMPGRESGDGSLPRNEGMKPSAPYSSLIITHHSLLITHYSLLITHHSLLITHYSLLITHYSLLITHYSLLITLSAHCRPRTRTRRREDSCSRAKRTPAEVSRYMCRGGLPASTVSQDDSNSVRSARRMRIGYKVPDFKPCCAANVVSIFPGFRVFKKGVEHLNRLR
jgi:hypothetical protein